MIVEAVETLFVPVGVYNNTKDDADAATVRRFAEPTWNNPVVRIIDDEGRDVVPRLHDDWSAAALLSRLNDALRAAKKPQPSWLQLIASEANANKIGADTSIFGMT